MNCFLAQSTTSVTLTNSMQGVCSDGTYYYVTDTFKLYKFNSVGTLISSRVISSDGTLGRIGAPFYKDGTLYVITDDYPTKFAGYVMEYNPSTLAYITEHQTASGKTSAALDFYNGSWWVTNYNNEVKEFDTSWNLLNTYAIPNVLSGVYNYDGIAWIDGDLWLNPHNDMLPEAIARFTFDGTDFTFASWVIRPEYCDQSLVWDGTNALLANRTNSQIVVAKGVTMANIGYAYDGSAITTTSTTYVRDETDGFIASIDVVDGDVIEVELNGNFKVSANGVRAYPDPASTNTVSLTEINNAATARTQVTSSEGSTHSSTKLFLANANGVAKFSMMWKMTAAGTATCNTRTIIAKKVGTIV